MKSQKPLFLYLFLAGAFLVVVGALLNSFYSIRGTLTLELNRESNFITNPKEFQFTIQTKDKTKTFPVSTLKQDFSGFPQYEIESITFNNGSPTIAILDNTDKSVTLVSKGVPFEKTGSSDEVAYIHNKDFSLPFRLKLKSLEISKNGLPKATLEVTSNYKKSSYNVYLNQPLEHLGYSVVLSAFNPRTKDLAVFIVSKDPYIYLIYCGALIILLAIITMFCNCKSRD